MHFREISQVAGRLSILTTLKTLLRSAREIQVNSRLILLLRSPTTMGTLAPTGEVHAPSLKDDLAPIRGIIFSLVLILPIWGCVAGVLWAVLR